MAPKESCPENEYYDAPYVPSDYERREWSTFPLRPVEAHNLLVNNAGSLSQADAMALRAIADGDYHPDQEIDLFSVQRELTLDGGYHDDED